MEKILSTKVVESIQPVGKPIQAEQSIEIKKEITETIKKSQLVSRMAMRQRQIDTLTAINKADEELLGQFE